MSKPIKLFFIVLLVVLTTGIAGGLFYYISTYIDDIVLSGEAYGFRIGDNKSQTYGAAEQVFEDSNIYILYPLDKNNFGPHREIKFNEKDYDILMAIDRWKMFFDTGYFNSIELTFEDGTLKRIYRHRKEFELP